MAVLEAMLTGIAASGAYDLTKEAALSAIRAIRGTKPELMEIAEIAAFNGDDAALRDALADALEVAAGSGEIVIDGGFLRAVRVASFDHEHGRMTIGNTTVSAPVLVTGGKSGASGETLIGGNTVLTSGGTSIRLGHGASIRMTGNASIRQS